MKRFFRSLVLSGLAALVLVTAHIVLSYIYNRSSPLAAMTSKTTITASLQKREKATSMMNASLSGASKSSSTSHHDHSSLASGLVSCRDSANNVNEGIWSDPNNGIVFARSLVSWPSFIVSVHNPYYDIVRWKSIYKKGAYYETHVHNHFVEILSPSVTSSSSDHTFIRDDNDVTVIDVGMNIGYYSLLSASLGVKKVVSFEINPSNVLRMCESIKLNEYYNIIDIYRRGVSNVDDQTLHVHVPSNPGQASMTTEDNAASIRNSQLITDADDIVRTITLDSYAQQKGWITLTSSKEEARPLLSNVTIAILKIDVEGHEPQVLLGAKQLLQSGLVHNVLTEFRHLQSEVSQAALAMILSAGYRLVKDHGQVMTLSESQTMLAQLTQHPSLGNPHPSTWHIVRSWFVGTPVMDLWFTLPETRGAL